MPSGYDGFVLELDIEVGGEWCTSYADAIIAGGEERALELSTKSHTVRYQPGYETQLECDGVAATITNEQRTACGGILQSPELSKTVHGRETRGFLQPPLGHQLPPEVRRPRVSVNACASSAAS
ncbi:MAG TPA: hypothetical protein VKY73_19315 [Polyangiaceae bacterium]|nr:hypothetical protein [Polyangiaceae bacterium]